MLTDPVSVQYLLLSLSIGVLALIVIVVSIWLLKQWQSPFTSLVALSVALLDSLGLALLPFLEWSLPYADAVVVYLPGSGVGLGIYARHVMAHILTLSIFLAFLIFAWVRSRGRLDRQGKTWGQGISTMILTRYGILVVGISLVWTAYFYYKYFVQGPGLSLLINQSLSFSSPEEAVTARSLAASQVGVGQGAFGALIASYTLVPYLVTVAVFLINRPGVFYTAWGIGLGLSLAYTLQTYQKAPVAFTVITYSVLLFVGLARKKGMSVAVRRGPFVVALLGAVVGVVLYVVNFGLGVGAALWSFVARVLLVPANTEGYWFWVYPALLPFWGLHRSLNTNMEIIRETAYTATGDIFSANASFIAVGWAGGGFLGVLLGTVTLVAYAFWMDSLSRKRPRVLSMLSGALLVPSLFFLNSGTVFDFLFKGGLLPALLLVSLRSGRAKAERNPDGGRG
ncbi:MAG: hypothetical protein WHT26_02285 [Thermus sp.]|uniref:hypothetical protein n=1 Tax=Thermus sp. TaxID=275 RepID=UPI00309CD1AD